MLTTKVGRVSWFDLTLKNAEQVRDFYKQVVGWQSSDVNIGGYSDYNMNDSEGKTVTGICHARRKRKPASTLADLHHRGEH